MLLLIDNYDSFTHNLAQAFGALGADLCIRRNDAITLDEIARARPDRIVISPGPGRPEAAGLSTAIIRRFGPRIPLLGVCLGHQAIGLVHGAEVRRLPRPMHGKASPITHVGRGLFDGLPPTIQVARYHSLIVGSDRWPDELEVMARSTDDDQIMAIRHRSWPVHGLQFHPESILTPTGTHILDAFLRMAD
jgi:anthranilate synthase/aminodeoxychorismate synthase-like glutamine amidotransferase